MAISLQHKPIFSLLASRSPHLIDGTRTKYFLPNSYPAPQLESMENTGNRDEEAEGEEEEEEEEELYSITQIDNYQIDAKDIGTSDSWIFRHPEMVRLTGRHPFNSEPPLPRLMEYGFLTPTALHYVRNHGYVPKVALEEWTVDVCGLVKRPQRLTMRQIMEEFKPRELPVTLVCAGNRRKEQNMVKQTVGFNWGAAAVGTSIWKGARLCDVLRRCGMYSRKKGALYVCFEGGELLPGGGEKHGKTRYGTSISVEKALSEADDVLLAYMQNGKPLEPDHGFPVRLIIPGYIGGRMVKWLTKIQVTDKESDNHYHYKDNRVLPSHVDAEKANAEGWWYKPPYIINELNINSVITSPAHGEMLPINLTTLQTSFTLKGYAYSGGGRKVIRVEVTTDGGQNWKLCDVSHPEKPTKYGKHWCWCFWQIETEIIELMQAKEVAVRAWDAAMNTQPENLTWNVMGMMNNCWFKVRINSSRQYVDGGGLGLVFEHPTRPGNQNGGWMVKNQENKSVLAKSYSSPSLTNEASRLITMAEVKKHNNADSVWIVVHNSVYDCSTFLEKHPGGKDSILINAGTDCTEEFDAIHSTKAKAMLEDYKIGDLAPSISVDSTPDNSVHGSFALFSISEGTTFKPVALSSNQKISCKLFNKKILSSDLRIFRFALPSQEQILGLPVGKHILVSAKINGKLCMRSYTPISSDEDVGYFDLLVRIYFKGVHPNFMEGGLMSQHLESMQIGDTVDVKGPVGHILYEGRGHFKVEGQPKAMKRCAMLAGGTGITPLYQLIRAIMKDPEDITEVHLVYANRREEDIMLRSELDKWTEECGKFKVWYVLSNVEQSQSWKYSQGYINEEIVKEHLPAGNDDSSTVAFLCGPPPMIEYACLPNLYKHGYQSSQCFVF